MKKLISVLVLLLAIAVLATSCNPNGGISNVPAALRGTWENNEYGVDRLTITSHTLVWQIGSQSVDMLDADVMKKMFGGSYSYSKTDSSLTISFSGTNGEAISPMSGYYKFVANEDGKTLTMTYYYKLDKPEMEPESAPESTSETIYSKVSD